mgnify:FL=1|jgi:hypothetical protein
MGVSDGVWECGKPKKVFHHFHAPERGGKGGGDFLFKAPEGPLFGSPFPPRGFAECMKRGVRNGGSARGFGTAERALSGKE